MAVLHDLQDPSGPDDRIAQIPGGDSPLADDKPGEREDAGVFALSLVGREVRKAFSRFRKEFARDPDRLFQPVYLQSGSAV